MSWDKEVDVVIIGGGGAGMTAAITAHENGAKVLVLEKGKRLGGSTRYSGGNIRTFVEGKNEIAAKHYELISQGTTDLEIYRAFVDESSKNVDWLKGLGAVLEATPNISIGYPYIDQKSSVFAHLPYSEGLGHRVWVKGKHELHGANLVDVLETNMQARKIDVLLDTPATKLITDEKNGVTGVEAETIGSGGAKNHITIKARRAVVLSSGGFEYDEKLQRNYFPFPATGAGVDTDDGDGIRMAQEIGADMWHMNAYVHYWGFKVPDSPVPIRFTVLSNRFILVDKFAKRFTKETGVEGHSITFLLSMFDPIYAGYPRVPTTVIVDSETLESGPIGWSRHGRARDFYQWSEDNSKEIEQGLIKKADTLEELAKQLDLDADAVSSTVRRYNEDCKSGIDHDYGRPADTLEALDKPPYYGAQLWPGIINTQGGPRRNSKAQIVSVRGQPIKRLYGAGELGSIFGVMYPGAGNISECLSFGRIAGKNAAEEVPWQ